MKKQNIFTIFAEYLTNIVKNVILYVKTRCVMDTKKDNFNRISQSRVKKINDLISKLQNLINPSFYEYDDEQISKMFDSIQDELDRQKEIFENEKQRKNKRAKL